MPADDRVHQPGGSECTDLVGNRVRRVGAVDDAEPELTPENTSSPIDLVHGQQRAALARRSKHAC
jgi:hypothetical protein